MTIPHNKPTIGKEEQDAAARVLASRWVASGPEVEAFEREFSEFHGSGAAAAVSSGSAALYLALKALGIKEGDEVIAPTYVCSAILNAVHMLGAKPVLVDISEDDLNISFRQAQGQINKRTKAIIVVHTFGMPAKMDEFVELGIPVIEDCAQALGAKYQGRPVGTFGKAAIYSFYASKVITTGYGGMVYSEDHDLVERIKDSREYDGREEYKQRFNFLMSDINAAIGREQLKKLPLFLERRKEIAERYYQATPDNEAWPPRNLQDREPNYYRFLIKERKGIKGLKGKLAEKGIGSIVPIENWELLHNYLKLDPKDFPVSEKISRETLSLPIFPSLTDKEVVEICNVIINAKDAKPNAKTAKISHDSHTI